MISISAAGIVFRVSVRRSEPFWRVPNIKNYLNGSSSNLNVPALDPGKGHQFDLQVEAEYKPVNPLRLSLEYTKSRLVRNDNHEVAFDTNIFSLRSTYQFTRFVFTRFRLDYDTLSSGASGQALFGWNPNPGTAFLHRLQR